MYSGVCTADGVRVTDHDSLTRSTAHVEAPVGSIPTQRVPAREARYAAAPLDLADPGVLLRSWMQTLHGPGLDPRPRTTGPLPSARQLLPTVLSWHVAYAVIALAGALAVQRSGSGSVVADELAAAGRPGLVVATLLLWWGGVAAATVLWWAGVASTRNR